MRPSNIPIDVPGTRPAPRTHVPEARNNAHEAAMQGAAGSLLVLAAGPIHATTLSDIEILLGRQEFSRIVVVAGQEHGDRLKQLKMEIYAVVGRMRRQTGVTTMTNDAWRPADVEMVVRAAEGGADVQGVLCYPHFASAGSEPTSVLALGEGELQASWEESVGFLHAVGRATVVPLLSRCRRPSNATANGSIHRTPRGPFLLVAGQPASSPSAQIAKAACDSLVLQLAQATSAQRLVVGYADTVLNPEPQHERATKALNRLSLQTEGYTGDPEDSAFSPGESPTKTYQLWAAQELGW